MPKKIRFESFKYHFLKVLSKEVNKLIIKKFEKKKFIDNIIFNYNNTDVKVSFEYPIYCEYVFNIKNVYFYKREDDKLNNVNEIKNKNDKFFLHCVNIILNQLDFNEKQNF